MKNITPNGIKDGHSLQSAALLYEAISGRRPIFDWIPSIAGLESAKPDSSFTLRLPERLGGAFEGNEWAWYRVALVFRGVMARDRPLGGDSDAPIDRRTKVREFLSQCDDIRLARSALSATIAVGIEGELWAVYPGLRNDLQIIQTHEARRIMASYPTQQTLRSRLLHAVVVAGLVAESTEMTVDREIVQPLLRVADWLHRIHRERSYETAIEGASELLQHLQSLPAFPSTQAPGLLVVLPGMPSGHPASDSLPEAPVVSRPSAGVACSASLEGQEILGGEEVRVWYRGPFRTDYYEHKPSGRLRPAEILVWRSGETLQLEHDDPGEGPVIEGFEDSGDAAPTPRPHEHTFEPEWHHSAILDLESHHKTVYRYPEWDSVGGSYLVDWCHVAERSVHGRPRDLSRYRDTVLTAHRSTLRRLRRLWQDLPSEGTTIRRNLSSGDDIDVDALVEALVDAEAGLDPDRPFYKSRVPLEREVACSILIDNSLSTADQVDVSTGKAEAVDSDAMTIYGKPRRNILDVQREAALLLGEVLDHHGDLYQVYTFSSEGRKRVVVDLVVDVDESMRLAAHKLAQVKPFAATRMAAAIRHVTKRLLSLGKATSILMVLTDGLPYDEDYSAPSESGNAQDLVKGGSVDYAIADTARALTEAENAGVKAHVLAVGGDLSGMEALAASISRVTYIRNVADLPESMVRSYFKIRDPRPRRAMATPSGAR